MWPKCKKQNWSEILVDLTRKWRTVPANRAKRFGSMPIKPQRQLDPRTLTSTSSIIPGDASQRDNRWPYRSVLKINWSHPPGCEHWASCVSSLFYSCLQSFPLVRESWSTFCPHSRQWRALVLIGYPRICSLTESSTCSRKSLYYLTVFYCGWCVGFFSTTEKSFLEGPYQKLHYLSQDPLLSEFSVLQPCCWREILQMQAICY